VCLRIVHAYLRKLGVERPARLTAAALVEGLIAWKALPVHEVTRRVNELGLLTRLGTRWTEREIYRKGPLSV
jgi:hypothetical protein